jgi:Fe-S cluster biosynthesis and repair protein YggX
MVINEYQLNLGDESGRAAIRKQLRAFFKLPDAEVEFKDYRT